jgi:hypothetical protein
MASCTHGWLFNLQEAFAVFEDSSCDRMLVQVRLVQTPGRTPALLLHTRFSRRIFYLLTGELNVCPCPPGREATKLNIDNVSAARSKACRR